MQIHNKLKKKLDLAFFSVLLSTNVLVPHQVMQKGFYFHGRRVLPFYLLSDQLV